MAGRRSSAATTSASLEPGKLRRFLHARSQPRGVSPAALSDPVAAVVFCAPTRARTRSSTAGVIVDDGEIVTLDLATRVVAEHNRNAARLAALAVVTRGRIERTVPL